MITRNHHMKQTLGSTYVPTNNMRSREMHATVVTRNKNSAYWRACNENTADAADVHVQNGINTLEPHAEDSQKCTVGNREIYKLRR